MKNEERDRFGMDYWKWEKCEERERDGFTHCKSVFFALFFFLHFSRHIVMPVVRVAGLYFVWLGLEELLISFILLC